MKAHLCKYIDFFRKSNFCLLLFFAPTVAFSQSLSPDYLLYIEKYKGIAIRQQQEYGIPSSITLAQGLLESGAGRSRLAREGNNHFGIKCHKTWKGESIYEDDDRRNECFRRYADATESFEDHARFLRRKRYAPLFELKTTDYKGWAKGLKKCGYATDPSYAAKLISIIELYNLDSFDSGQPIIAQKKALVGDESLEHSIDMEIINEFRLVHKIRRRWGLHFVTAYEGDTYQSIADEFGFSKRKLLSYNDLPKRAKTPGAGDVIYLQEKYEAGNEDTHTVQPGETAYSIAQYYGIKLKSLLKLNHLKQKDALKAGQTLRLR